MKGKWVKVKEDGIEELEESDEYRSEVIDLEEGLEQVFLKEESNTFSNKVAKTLQVEANHGFEQVTLHFGEVYHAHLTVEQTKKLIDLLRDGLKIIKQYGLDSEMLGNPETRRKNDLG